VGGKSTKKNDGYVEKGGKGGGCGVETIMSKRHLTLPTKKGRGGTSFQEKGKTRSVPRKKNVNSGEKKKVRRFLGGRKGGQTREGSLKREGH